MMELLVKHGANINQVDDKGRTALIYAAHDHDLVYYYPPWHIPKWKKQGEWYWHLCRWFHIPLVKPQPCSGKCVIWLLERQISTIYNIRTIKRIKTCHNGYYAKQVVEDYKGMNFVGEAPSWNTERVPCGTDFPYFSDFAVTPAVRANCIECTKLMIPHQFQIDKCLSYIRQIMGRSYRPEVYQALRDGILRRGHRDTLFGCCRQFIRHYTFNNLSQSLHTVVARLPLPMKMKESIIETQDSDDWFIYHQTGETGMFWYRQSY